MALTHIRTLEVAEQGRKLANRLQKLHADIRTFLDQNSDISIDWAGDPKPAYINEDVDGNIDGKQFTRQQMANAIGTFDQLNRLLTNQTITQGDHLGNLNQLASVGNE